MEHSALSEVVRRVVADEYLRRSLHDAQTVVEGDQRAEHAESVVSQAEQRLGLQELEFRDQVLPAVGDLVGLAGSVVGGPALHRVRDEAAVSRNAGRDQQFVEQASCAPHEGHAGVYLLATRRLAVDDEEEGIAGSDRRNAGAEVGTRLAGHELGAVFGQGGGEDGVHESTLARNSPSAV